MSQRRKSSRSPGWIVRFLVAVDVVLGVALYLAHGGWAVSMAFVTALVFAGLTSNRRRRTRRRA